MKQLILILIAALQLSHASGEPASAQEKAAQEDKAVELFLSWLKDQQKFSAQNCRRATSEDKATDPQTNVGDLLLSGIGPAGEASSRNIHLDRLGRFHNGMEAYFTRHKTSSDFVPLRTCGDFSTALKKNRRETASAKETLPVIRYPLIKEKPAPPTPGFPILGVPTPWVSIECRINFKPRDPLDKS